MGTYESWSLIAEFAAILINMIAFIAVGWQLRLLAHQNRQTQQATVQDHERRRKQATLEFYAATHERQMEFRKTMPNSWAADEIAALTRKGMDGDGDTIKAISGFLSLYEHLAAGVRANVYDLEVINKMASGRIIAMHRNYRPWIAYRRELLGECDFYSELEWLADELFKLRTGLGLIRTPGPQASSREETLTEAGN